MGRVADAFTKAFPQREEPLELLPMEDPWELAENPENTEPPPDTKTSPVASKPHAGSPPATPALHVSPEPAVAPAANVTPVPHLVPVPHAAPAPRVVPPPGTVPASQIAPVRHLIPVPNAAPAAAVPATPHDRPLTVVAPRPKARTQPTEIRGADGRARRRPEDRKLLREVALPAREASASGDPRYNGKLVGDDELSFDVREQFRNLAAALFHSGRQTGTRVLLVTSALPGEGKTLVSSNVAETLSDSFGLRVLLIDADLRRPSVHSVFDLAPSPGLSESLASDLETAVPATKVSPKLSVVVAGQPPSDPAEIVAGAAMQRLLKHVSTEFDWVILDSPPLGLASDAALVAELADKVLLVVKAGETPYPAVMDVVKNLGSDRVLGVVLNQADHSTADPYGDASQGYSSDSLGKLEQQSL